MSNVQLLPGTMRAAVLHMSKIGLLLRNNWCLWRLCSSMQQSSNTIQQRR